MGKHVQVRRRRMARAVLPVTATAILTGALAASPLGMAATADPGPGDGGGDHHHGGGGDGWDGHHHDGDWDGHHHDGGWGTDDRPAPHPAPVAAPAAAPAPAAPAPAEPVAPVVQVKRFPYTAPTLETDLSGLTLEKGGTGDLVKSGPRPTSDDPVGAIVGTGVALASIGGFAAVLAAGRARREVTP